MLQGSYGVRHLQPTFVVKTDLNENSDFFWNIPLVLIEYRTMSIKKFASKFLTNNLLFVTQDVNK